MLKLRESPRLYVTPDVVANLKNKLHSPFLQTHAQQVLRDADWLVRTPPLKEGQERTYQVGTRSIDSQLQCLTCAWVLTHEARYRKAAIKHLAGLLAWRQISCEANATISADVTMSFCLSYGELSSTVGLMYDLFRPELTEAEQKVFFALLDKFLLRAALKCLETPPWWANKIWSNWNGVCAGGMGVMALAFYDDKPDARKLIPFVEASLGEYFKSYIQNGGGCAEGTGYWNYGMTFAMRYVQGWESATKQNHPALDIPELGASLFFPIDFTGVSFGDNDGWGPMAFYFQMAKRLKIRDAALNAAAYLPARLDPGAPRSGQFAARGDLLYAADLIPTEAEMARLKAAHQKKKVPVARVYRGLEWAVLADDEAFPALRMAVRGGSSAIAGHAMIDLLSIRCRVNGQLMITDQPDGPYMATTFGKRGHEIYGRSAASKSTLFVDGLGADTNATCDKTEVVKGRDVAGIRVDGSHIFIPRWNNVFIGRLVLLVENAYWLVIDQVKSANPVEHHWAESRFHTYAAIRAGRDSVSLKSGKQSLQMTFAALQKGVIREARGMPSQSIVKATTILRWMGEAATNDNLHVVALNPGNKKLKLAVRKKEGKGYEIEVTQPGGRKRILRLGPSLTLLPSK